MPLRMSRLKYETYSHSFNSLLLQLLARLLLTGLYEGVGFFFFLQNALYWQAYSVMKECCDVATMEGVLPKALLVSALEVIALAEQQGRGGPSKRRTAVAIHGPTQGRLLSRHRAG